MISTVSERDRAGEWLFGWDPTPGIVSVLAGADGSALVWRRTEGRLSCERERFRPWVLAANMDDLAHLNENLRAEHEDPEAPFTYRRLDGDGDYPFLISCRHGRTLERTLLERAAQRTGRPAGSLRSLPEYYRLGWVEQYLTITGRTYYRDLEFDDLLRLQLDLETTSLSPDDGRVFMVAVRDSSGFETVLEAPGADDERQLILNLCALVRERSPDVIENHNLIGFDLPFLERRANKLGIALELGREPGPLGLTRTGEGRDARYSVAGREILDTLDAVRRHDFVARDLPGHGLKPAARYFGVAGPDREYIPGDQVASTYRTNPERVRRYALDDVREVDGLSRILHAPAVALSRMAPRRLERVATAGAATGILEPMLVRAYLREGAALPASDDPPNAGAHAGGAVVLYATGIAENVAKADVASLYPSLIRTYAIGPSRDRLGVFVTLVDRLTELRLRHKRLGQNDGPQAAGHRALSAAMKLVVNSAYGYLGAGTRLALLADRRAADEVTRRGRQVLESVCRELEARGATLIEADTDGVYFRGPPGWDEARERAVIGEVSDTLPPAIDLQLDGRYRAMYSHEVKNYALLTHDGRLILRGGALRSSRAEPFGEVFLERALRCLLANDVPGARDVFLDTVGQLERRELTAYELSTRAALTKTPEEYRESRARRNEASYEAVLAAGRTVWQRGERVRYYRADGGRFVLLPADWDEARAFPGRDYDVRHYKRILRDSFAERLRKALDPADFEQVFRAGAQPGLFDEPIASMTVRSI